MIGRIKKKKLYIVRERYMRLKVAIKAFTEPVTESSFNVRFIRHLRERLLQMERQVVNNALKYDGEGYYTIDFEDFEEKPKNERTKLFILCNPHNPTGRIFKIEELKRLSDICAENNVIIVADEIHGDLIRKSQTFTPIAKAAEDTDHIITFTAINKTFNLAGLHCTNAVISNPELRKKFSRSCGYEISLAIYDLGSDLQCTMKGKNG